MNYSNIIDDFTWSHSRIGSFKMCPYMFYLTYIEGEKDEDMFFSSYGSFIHKIIEKYLKHELNKDELPTYYLLNYSSNVKGKIPSPAIGSSYFQKGLDYFKNINFPYENPIGVEEKMSFTLGRYRFVGVIDCLAKDNGELIILDNKSHNLKPRSLKKIPTKTDLELDEYLEQLYLYSIPVFNKYGKYPERLEFNCFRNGNHIVEKFDKSKLDLIKEKTLSSIEEIKNNENWEPSMEDWKCRYICGLHNKCDYFLINER